MLQCLLGLHVNGRVTVISLYVKKCLYRDDPMIMFYFF